MSHKFMNVAFLNLGGARYRRIDLPRPTSALDHPVERRPTAMNSVTHDQPARKVTVGVDTCTVRFAKEHAEVGLALIARAEGKLDAAEAHLRNWLGISRSTRMETRR